MHQFNNDNLLWLYKFRPLTEPLREFALRILSDNELYFSSPESFNDPFDCRPAYAPDGSPDEIKAFLNKLFSRNMPHETNEKIKQEAERCYAEFFSNGKIDTTASNINENIWRNIKRFGVCSLSEDWKSILMWSHYADHHKGICFRFRADKHTPFFGTAQRVEYRDEMPVVNPILRDHRENVLQTLLTKSREWAYEKEWRILNLSSGVGVQKFPPHTLHSVLLGARISAADETEVRRLAEQHPNKPRVSKLRIASFKYELEISK